MTGTPRHFFWNGQMSWGIRLSEVDMDGQAVFSFIDWLPVEYKGSDLLKEASQTLEQVRVRCLSETPAERRRVAWMSRR